MEVRIEDTHKKRGITIVFGDIVKPAPVKETLLKDFAGGVAAAVGIDEDEVQINGDHQSISLTGGAREVVAFLAITRLALPGFDYHEVGIRVSDDPDGLRGQEGDLVFSVPSFTEAQPA